MTLFKIKKFIQPFWKDERGITGLETAIILIAFVVVAAVFAFAILNAGLGATSNAEDAITTAQSETQSTLAPRGDVILVAKDDLSTVNVIKFKLAPSPGAKAISLADEITLIQYSDNNTAAETAKLGDKGATCLDPKTEATWLTGSGDVVDAGEIVEVTVNLKDNCLKTNETWKIEVFPRDGAIVSVQGKTPVELSKNMAV